MDDKIRSKLIELLKQSIEPKHACVMVDKHNNILCTSYNSVITGAEEGIHNKYYRKYASNHKSSDCTKPHTLYSTYVYNTQSYDRFKDLGVENLIYDCLNSTDATQKSNSDEDITIELERLAGFAEAEPFGACIVTDKYKNIIGRGYTTLVNSAEEMAVSDTLAYEAGSGYLPDIEKPYKCFFTDNVKKFAISLFKLGVETFTHINLQNNNFITIYEDKEELAKEKFIKFSKHKPKPSLIPASTLRALAEVLTYGANKYEKDNWKKCDDISEYTDALIRHLTDYLDGITHDTESGLPVMWCILANAAFLNELDETQKHKVTPVNEELPL